MPERDIRETARWIILVFFFESDGEISELSVGSSSCGRKVLCVGSSPQREHCVENSHSQYKF